MMNARRRRWLLFHDADPRDYCPRPTDYAAFLRSEDWQRTREHVLLRDDGHCVVCGDPAEEVHHVSYWSLIQPSLCISVCKHCHAELDLERENDGPGHLVWAPAVRLWAEQTFGPDWVVRYTDADVGSRWLKAKKDRARAERDSNRDAGLRP